MTEKWWDSASVQDMDKSKIKAFRYVVRKKMREQNNNGNRRYRKSIGLKTKGTKVYQKRMNPM